MLRHLLCLLREIGNLPFALNDKWSAEADLATVRAAALELANEETCRLRAAFVQAKKEGLPACPRCGKNDAVAYFGREAGARSYACSRCKYHAFTTSDAAVPAKKAKTP